jgi:exonuclease VII small subunit
MSVSQHLDSESWDAKVEELSRIVMEVQKQRLPLDPVPLAYRLHFPM